ncbi:MAG: hypothetical protein KW788_00070 [Candidatus Doudnabacteria bacterium]|nr:hypothetical protein [Candidatus Doudnabacteria bacterium]
MPHYVCPSCGSMSEGPQACETGACPMIGREMLECNCTDEQHGEIMGKAAV